MSDDGAHLGVGAGRAAQTILSGADQPTDDERKSPEQMREWLLGAGDSNPWDAIQGRWPDPWARDADGNRDPEAEAATDAGYEEAARQAGKLVLGFLDEHPRWRQLPADDDVTFPERDDGPDWNNPAVTRVGIHTLMGLADVGRAERLSEFGLSGFQWGWAVNAAKYAVGAPPVQNPAIMTVQVDG